MNRVQHLLRHLLPEADLQLAASQHGPTLPSSALLSSLNCDGGISVSGESPAEFSGPLNDDIQFLSGILLRNIAKYEGEEIAQTVQQLVALSQAYREHGDEAKFQALLEKIHALVSEPATSPPGPGQHHHHHSHDPSEATPLLSKKVLQVARAFHELLSLANVAESHHRIRRWRLYLLGAGQLQQKQQPEDVFPQLIAAGFSPQQIQQRMSEQICDYVLTAHPTQATRRTLLAKYEKIASLLNVRDRKDLSPNAKKHLAEDFEREVVAAWHTNTVRRNRPTPQDEARGCLAVVEDSLWDALPVFLQSVDDSLKKINAPPLPPDRSTVRISSWVCGDRDGNPRVTHKTTFEVVALNRYRAADLYYKEIDQLMWELSMTKGSPDLWALVKKVNRATNASKASEGATTTRKPSSLVADNADTPLPSSAATSANPSAAELNTSRKMSRDYFRDTAAKDEPYRYVLAWIREQCLVTRTYWQLVLESIAAPTTQGESRHPFARAKEYLASRAVNIITRKVSLLGPLRVIHQSLLTSGDAIIADGRLKALMRRVDAFGLSLLKLDIRQESARHEEVLNAITSYLGLGSYLEWTDEQRLDFLTRELDNVRPLFNWQHFFASRYANEDVKEVLLTFQTIADLGAKPGGAFGAYVISMCKKPTHLLEVALLQKEAGLGLGQTLRIVPLFETEADLVSAPETMKKVWSLPAYFKRLHNLKQEIMIGYSDSSKDAGRITSVWSLYLAQEALVELSHKVGIQLTLFHGRGGSVGRGGGPQHQSILSQPPGSVQNHLRLTIQGEVIEKELGLRKVAQTSFGRYSSATLLATMLPVPPAKKEWRECMSLMSEISSKHYRSYVFQLPDFVAYFQSATPVLELSDLKLGSRPSRRKAGGGVETLRAIPWIFSWTQNRFHLPVWLGLGKALQVCKEKGHLETMKDMAANWAFFSSTLSLIEMVLIKADARIAARYDQLLVPRELKHIGENLRKDLEQTTALLLEVKNQPGLLISTSPEEAVTLRSIIPRLPYVDPLNLLQAELMALMRREHIGEGERRDQLVEDSFAVVSQGISAGMQNTG